MPLNLLIWESRLYRLLLKQYSSFFLFLEWRNISCWSFGAPKFFIVFVPFIYGLLNPEFWFLQFWWWLGVCGRIWLKGSWLLLLRVQISPLIFSQDSSRGHRLVFDQHQVESPEWKYLKLESSKLLKIPGEHHWWCDNVHLRNGFLNCVYLYFNELNSSLIPLFTTLLMFSLYWEYHRDWIRNDTIT